MSYNRARTKQKPATIAAAAGLVALLGAGGVGYTLLSGQKQEVVVQTAQEQEADEPESNTEDASPSTEASVPASIFIHIDGAVQNPGVYELTGSSIRGTHALEAAGGTLSEADTSSVNLAAPLSDGDKVYIPFKGEEVQISAETSSSGGTTTASSSSLININTATLEELKTLNGVGDATASAIIASREELGPFTSVDDLMRVSGIGEKKLAKIKDAICV